jgi:fructose-1-phosphate kinase PfkB-like protein
MNPTLQKTLLFPSLAIDEVNRTERHWLDASGKGVNVSRETTLRTASLSARERSSGGIDA